MEAITGATDSRIAHLLPHMMNAIRTSSPDISLSFVVKQNRNAFHTVISTQNATSGEEMRLETGLPLLKDVPKRRTAKVRMDI